MTGKGLNRGLGQTIEWRIILCYLCLVVIGVLSIFAAGHSAEGSASLLDLSTRAGKQILWAGDFPIGRVCHSFRDKAFPLGGDFHSGLYIRSAAVSGDIGLGLGGKRLEVVVQIGPVEFPALRIVEDNDFVAIGPFPARTRVQRPEDE